MKEEYQAITVTAGRASLDEDRNGLPTQDWPQEPISLVENRIQSLFYALFDLALTAIPILLLVKIGLIVHAWKVDSLSSVDAISQWTAQLLAVNGQLVTLFTIIFIATVGTLLRRYALWKAQEGAYIAELEQLQGSTSVTNTFKLIWSLRAWSFTSVILVLIWGFYYLGSQANKYEYRFVATTPVASKHSYVRTLEFPSVLTTDLPYGSRLSPQFEVFAADLAVRVQELTSAVDHAAMSDQFYRPVIPDLGALLGSAIKTNDSKGWVHFTKDEMFNSGPYPTSRLGKQLWYPDLSAISQLVGKYDMSTSYLEVRCDVPSLLAYDAAPTSLSDSKPVFMQISGNKTVKDSNGNVLQEFEVWNRWLGSQISSSSSNDTASGASARTVCNITEVMVQTSVTCQKSQWTASTGCTINKMRYLNGAGQQAATRYSTPFNSDIFTTNFLGNLTNLSSNLQSATIFTSTALSDYAIEAAAEQDGSSNAWTTGLDSDGSSVSGTLNNFQYAYVQELQMWLNTLYIATQDTTMYVNQTVINAADPQHFTPVTIHGSIYNPHYAISWPWIAMDAVSSLVLLAAALASCYLRLHTLAPDIFGYVSSLTRDNPHIHLPDNGSTLSGLERARLLRGVKVKIGDVSRDDEEIGRIGLARVDTGRARIAPLKVASTYV